MSGMRQSRCCTTGSRLRDRLRGGLLINNGLIRKGSNRRRCSQPHVDLHPAFIMRRYPPLDSSAERVTAGRTQSSFTIMLGFIIPDLETWIRVMSILFVGLVDGLSTRHFDSSVSFTVRPPPDSNVKMSSPRAMSVVERVMSVHGERHTAAGRASGRHIRPSQPKSIPSAAHAQLLSPNPWSRLAPRPRNQQKGGHAGDDCRLRVGLMTRISATSLTIGYMPTARNG